MARKSASAEYSLIGTATRPDCSLKCEQTTQARFGLDLLSETH
jgi:hypothetical protein